VKEKRKNELEGEAETETREERKMPQKGVN
jgi:hypothetical protein